jgi:adenylate kinase family enzyme
VRRVLVIGSGGAGKSTVARAIAAAAGLPLVHLDRLYWRPGWVPTPTAEWAEVVGELVARDRWVIDGNYGGTMPVRFSAADTVVFLDTPRFRCLVRVTKRAVIHRGSTRDDMPPGCPERITWEFVRWIWTYPAIRRPGVLRMLEEFEYAAGGLSYFAARRRFARFLTSIPRH